MGRVCTSPLELENLAGGMEFQRIREKEWMSFLPKAVGHESKRGMGWREGQREGEKGIMGGQGKERNNLCMEMPQGNPLFCMLTLKS